MIGYPIVTLRLYASMYYTRAISSIFILSLFPKLRQEEKFKVGRQEDPKQIPCVENQNSSLIYVTIDNNNNNNNHNLKLKFLNK